VPSWVRESTRSGAMPCGARPVSAVRVGGGGGVVGAVQNARAGDRDAAKASCVMFGRTQHGVNRPPRWCDLERQSSPWTRRQRQSPERLPSFASRALSCPGAGRNVCTKRDGVPNMQIGGSAFGGPPSRCQRQSPERPSPQSLRALSHSDTCNRKPVPSSRKRLRQAVWPRASASTKARLHDPEPADSGGFGLVRSRQISSDGYKVVPRIRRLGQDD
jgi:hypothetical protein